jgi:hypothetical protein
MRRRTLLAGLAAAAAGSVAGCGYRPGGGDFRWSRNAGLFAPDFLDADGDRWLSGRRATDTFDPETESFVTVGSATVLDPGGDAVFEAEFDSPLRAVALDGEAVVGLLADGTVARADPDAGDDDLRWRTPALPAGEDDGNGIPSSDRARADPSAVAVADGTAYVTDGTALAALDLGGGTRRWRRPPDGPVTALEPWSGGVYAVAGGRLLALGRDGSTRWTDAWPTDPSRSIVRADGSGAYLVDPGEVRALDHDGTERWTLDEGAADDPRPTLHSGTLYLGGGGVVAAVSTGGDRRWTASAGAATGRIAAAGGRAYVAGGSELVGIEAGSRVWSVGLDRPRRFDHEVGPFVVGGTLVLGGSERTRGYWRSRL